MSDSESRDDLLAGIGAVFESLGRSILCLDADFRVVHASGRVQGLLDHDGPKQIVGTPVADLLGTELFAEGGYLRQAVLAGERREGWGATVRGEGDAKLVSVTVAPMRHVDTTVCDPRVAYIVVLRPAATGGVEAPRAGVLFAGMLAASPQMHRVFRLIQNLQHSDATVLITGESGTGKELVARAIHEHSQRSSGEFIAVNCGAIPQDLLESELFGHVKGAFTGAVQDRVGRFELAAGGTLFLDEIGDMPLALQVKLLRVLQDGTYQRVGESGTRTTDARILAATNANLRSKVGDGTFREDLYYRLRVVPIRVPPLRVRREDIEPLAYHLLAKVSRRHGRELSLAPATVRVLMQHDWPGNVRELENALEYAVAVCRGQTIHPRDLPSELSSETSDERHSESQDLYDNRAPPPPTASGATARRGIEPASEPAEPGPVGGVETSSERAQLVAALEANRWQREATAESLGISRTTLWRRMKEHGLLD